MEESVLKAIFASMEQGVIFIDDRNRVAYCNPAAERIRGVRYDEIVGKSIMDCHPFSRQPQVLQMIEGLRSGRIRESLRMNVQFIEGRFYDGTFSAVWGPDDHYLGVVVVSQEVTDRKKAEDELKEALEKLRTANDELRHLNQTKDIFLSNVSHELKTPMISVMGYVGMILKEKAGALTEQQRKFLEISYRNLLKLEKNIDNLLDLAELGIRKEAWTFEPTDLCRVVEFSCFTVKPLASEHEIELDLRLPSEPILVSGVEEKLHQLFDNLLTNAIKYNRQGGRIAVSVDGDARFAFTRVADTGIGISHQSLREVFTRHFQEGASALGKTKGLGIGLSLVHEIVELHRGKIEIESEPGKGSTFTIMLPKRS